jgi:integrase
MRLEYRKLTTRPNIAPTETGDTNAPTGQHRPKSDPHYVRLNSKNIDKLKPPASGRDWHRDDLLTPFALCLHASGCGTFTVDLSVKGGAKKPQTKIGRMDRWTPEKARAQAKEWLMMADAGIDPIGKLKADKEAAVIRQAIGDITVAVLRDRFLGAMKPGLRPSTFEQYSRLLLHPCKALGHIVARELTAADVQDYFAERPMTGHGSDETRKQMVMFQQFCRWGTKTYNRAARCNYLDSDPSANLSKPKKSKGRERYLSDQETVAYWRACDGLDWPFGPLFKLLLVCGTRCGETVRARWTNIDLDAGIWHIPADDAKNKREHDVYLSALAISILRAIPRFEGTDLVFSYDGKSPATAFSYYKRKVATAMGRGPQWQLHDMRRVMTSGLARLGVAPHVADRMLNHQSGTISGVAAIYNRYEYRDERREASNLWGRYIEQLTGENVVPLDRLTA